MRAEKTPTRTSAEETIRRRRKQREDQEEMNTKTEEIKQKRGQEENHGEDAIKERGAKAKARMRSSSEHDKKG
eukprot:2769510-Rhodomonas_salina.4